MQAATDFYLKGPSLLAGLVVVLGFLTGCGRPPSMGGPPEDSPIRAVVAMVEETELQETFAVVGSVSAQERVDLLAELDARVEKILFDEGQSVAQGQPLFQLDQIRLEARKKEAQANLVLAQANFERGKTLLADRSVSTQDFDRLSAELQQAEAALTLAEKDWGDAKVTAPFAGRISERAISVGQFVSRGTKLASLVDDSVVEVEFYVPERLSSQVAMGQTVQLITVAYPEVVFEGQVSFISPRMEERNRSVLVKARIENQKGSLKDGMFGSLRLEISHRDQALVVPEGALFFQGDQAMVVKVDPEGRAQFQPVEVGLRLAGKAEIRSGLIASDRIVAEGWQKMGPGTKVDDGSTPPEAEEPPQPEVS